MSEVDEDAVSPPVTRVQSMAEFLDDVGLQYELIEHPVALGPAERASGMQRPPGELAHTVVLHDGPLYAFATIPGDGRLDLEKLRPLLGAGPGLRLASEREIARHFPMLELGAIPPFGPTVPATGVIDASLARQERILCPVGDHRHSVRVDPRATIALTGARTGDICAD